MSNAAPTFLEQFFQLQLQAGGSPVPKRPTLSIVGGSLSDDPTEGVTTLTVGAGVVQSVVGLRTFAPTGARQSISIDYYQAVGDGGGGLFVWNASDTRADDSGTVIAVTGISTGRWNRVNPAQGVCHAKHYGCVGDGVTDDHASLTGLLAAAEALGLPAHLPFGVVFGIGSKLTVPSGVTLTGGGTIKCLATGFDALYVNGGTANSFDGVSVQLAAGSSTDNGIRMVNCTRSKVSGCTIVGAGDSGVRCDGGSDYAITGNIIDGSGATVGPSTNGIYLANGSGGQSNATITGNDVAHTGQGIATGVSPLASLVVSGNTVHDITAPLAQHGMYLASDNLTVTGNAIRGFNISGIKINSAASVDEKGVVIAGNAIDGCWTPPWVPQVDVRAGEVVTPGNGYRYVCTTPGLTGTDTTTIASGSNGQNLALGGTVDVASSASFPASGQVVIYSSAGYQLVTYTGKGSGTLTGCSGGTGTLATGSSVTSVPVWPTGSGATVADGTAVWTRGALTSFPTGSYFTPGNGSTYQATAGGTSAGGAVVYPTTIGQTVTDGTITWTCVSNALLAVGSGIDLSGPISGTLLDAIVAANAVQNVSGYGVSFGEATSGVKVSGNNLLNIGASGIIGQQTFDKPDVAGNTLSGTCRQRTGGGVLLNGTGTNVRVRGNTFDGIPSNLGASECVFIGGVVGVEVVANRMIGNDNATALKLSSSSAETIRDNVADSYAGNVGVSTTVLDRNSWDLAAKPTLSKLRWPGSEAAELAAALATVGIVTDATATDVVSHTLAANAGSPGLSVSVSGGVRVLKLTPDASGSVVDNFTGGSDGHEVVVVVQGSSGTLSFSGVGFVRAGGSASFNTATNAFVVIRFVFVSGENLWREVCRITTNA